MKLTRSWLKETYHAPVPWGIHDDVKYHKDFVIYRNTALDYVHIYWFDKKEWSQQFKDYQSQCLAHVNEYCASWDKVSRIEKAQKMLYAYIKEDNYELRDTIWPEDGYFGGDLEMWREHQDDLLALVPERMRKFYLEDENEDDEERSIDVLAIVWDYPGKVIDWLCESGVINCG